MQIVRTHSYLPVYQGFDETITIIIDCGHLRSSVLTVGTSCNLFKLQCKITTNF